MNENRFKFLAKKLLDKWGLKALDIPKEPNSKTPDFYAQDSQYGYIIELKIKGDDPLEIKKEQEILSRDGMVEKTIPTSPRNTLAGIIEDGVKQLVKYDPQHENFHLLWLHSEGQDPDLLRRRFYATLFGSQDFTSSQISNLICCLYFNESCFYAFREQLDGAIITFFERKDGIATQFCLNSLSPRAEEFRKSELYKQMQGIGLNDPKVLEPSDSYMVADCRIDRKNQNEVIRYLCEKYNLDYLNTRDPKMHSWTISIPKGKEM